MGQEIFPVMRGGAGMGQEKSMRGGGEDLILRPRPAPLPSLVLVGVRVAFLSECPLVLSLLKHRGVETFLN